MNKKDAEIEPRRLALVVEYEGTGYQGFQWQPNGPTIQGELEVALLKLTGQETRVAGASRTDTGVHARGQVLSFVTPSLLPIDTFVAAMNYYLPQDIAIKAAIEAPRDFDPRRDALSRRYTYSILNSRTRSPLVSRFSHLILGHLDIEAMESACGGLIGIHDFASFSGRQDDPGASTVRHIFDAHVAQEGGLTTVEMEANAFLTHQVRRTVGELVEVAQGRKRVEEFLDLIRLPRTGAAGPTLPARGLCLEEVTYLDVDLRSPAVNKGLLTGTLTS